jgi:hypothetical protein
VPATANRRWLRCKPVAIVISLQRPRSSGTPADEVDRRLAALVAEGVQALTRGVWFRLPAPTTPARCAAARLDRKAPDGAQRRCWLAAEPGGEGDVRSSAAEKAEQGRLTQPSGPQAKPVRTNTDSCSRVTRRAGRPRGSIRSRSERKRRPCSGRSG